MTSFGEIRNFENSLFPNIGMGLGLRSPHFQNVLNAEAKVDWFEVVSENYMGIKDGGGGRQLKILEKVRKNYSVVLHGVSLNIGSTDPLNTIYLKKLKDLILRIEPKWVSDHLCWTGVKNENLHDLLPLPYTQESINHVVERITKSQEILGTRLVFENVSSYISFKHSEMSEWEFISEISQKSDCGILLDINNVYVSSKNHGFDPLEFLKNIPPHRVAQFHLAGHLDLGTHLVDTHDGPVCPEVWSLYKEAINLFGNISTMIEWDAKIPDFKTLQNEVFKAAGIQSEVRYGRIQDSVIT